MTVTGHCCVSNEKHWSSAKRLSCNYSFSSTKMLWSEVY